MCIYIYIYIYIHIHTHTRVYAYTNGSFNPDPLSLVFGARYRSVRLIGWSNNHFNNLHFIIT